MNPELKAEDETGIIKKPTYDGKTDGVLDYCGSNGRKECLEHYVFTICDDEDAYNWLLENMGSSKVENYARVIMINPLYEKLPRTVLRLQATCNCFSSDML